MKIIRLLVLFLIGLPSFAQAACFSSLNGNVISTCGNPSAIAVPATPTAGTNVTSCSCATATCTNLRGSLTIVGGTATTGTICSPAWPSTTIAYVCTATMNGGATSFGIGNSVATATGMNITSAVSVAAATLTVNYECQP